MNNPVHALGIGTFTPMLRCLSSLLDAGAAHAADKGFAPDELVNARLAEDMYPLARQVQIACDMAKNSTARILGLEPPRFEDVEQTLDELKARIAKTIAYLEGLPEGAFDGAESRDVVMPLIGTLVLEQTGLAHLRDWALPNFYFHVVTAYDILRSKGVEIGKRDFMAVIAGRAIHDRGPAGA